MGRCSIFGRCFSRRNSWGLTMNRKVKVEAFAKVKEHYGALHQSCECDPAAPADIAALASKTLHCSDVVVLFNNTGTDGPTLEDTTITQPLPSVTEPPQFALRSISIGGDIKDGSFACKTSPTDADRAAGALPARASPHPRVGPPTQLSLRASSTGAEHSCCASSKRHTSFENSAAAAAASQRLDPRPVPERTLLESSGALDGLTTADLTVDVAAAGATALLWPDNAVAEPRSGSAAVSPRDRRFADSCPRQPSQLSQRPAAAAAEPGQPGSAVAAAADGVREAAEPGPPSTPALPRAVLNLSQVRDCVQELWVLHIRPGAALLIGKATAGGQRVVARFERGRPASLLAPQLLAALQEGHWQPHRHVVSMMAVHTVVLPAQVLEAQPAGCDGATADDAAAAAGGGGSAAVAGLWELLDEDLATAARALQHAEAVRGASSTTAGSGLIGSSLTSGSHPVGSGRVLTALGGPQVRLRDVVGHLRSGGDGGAGAVLRPPPSPLVAATLAAPGPAAAGADVAFVTLSIMELCQGGHLADEVRRGAFKCCCPPDPAVGGCGGGASRGRGGGGGGGVLRSHLRCFGDAQLLQRLERLIATAREVAAGLHFLHTACGLAHGDLASRNVLLQRRSSDDPRVGGGGEYVAKLTGYGRLAVSSPKQDADGASTSSSSGGGGGASGMSGGDEQAAANSLPSDGAAITHLSATSLSRVNSVHVGLWRDIHSLAPERLRDPEAPPSFEADLYAYGTILYEMAVGEPPWASMLPACVAVGVATGELRLQWPQHAGAPPLPALVSLLGRCTAPAPAERPSAGEVLATLQDAEEELIAGREAAEALRQQRLSEQLAHTFLDMDTVSTSSSASASRRSSYSGGGGGGSGEEPLLEVFMN